MYGAPRRRRVGYHVQKKTVLLRPPCLSGGRRVRVHVMVYKGGVQWQDYTPRKASAKRTGVMTTDGQHENRGDT